jgi:hypothetical protein
VVGKETEHKQAKYPICQTEVHDISA